MEQIDLILLLGATILFAGLLFGSLSTRIGVPSLLVFLIVGMLAGESGPGGIQFDNLDLGYFVSNLALAIILLDGGVHTKTSSFRVALKPALSLATFGVISTSILVGAFATWLLNIDWRIGLLLGSIVGSTDAAAVFSILRSGGVNLNERVSGTLEVESASNDPMAIFLTITLIDILTQPGASLGFSTLLMLIKGFGIGTILGFLLAIPLAGLLRRLHGNEGLHVLLLGAGGIAIFTLTNLVGGSGFLAIYIAGVVVGNRHGGVGDNILHNMNAFGWLAQSCMFLLLGLLVDPTKLLAILPQAIMIALFLMLVARPAAVFLLLKPMAFPWAEKLFISWTGLRGAVPITLAMFPLVAGIEHAQMLFNIAFMVVIISLLVQGTSMRWLSKLLHIDLPAPPAPLQITAFAGSNNLYLMQFAVEEGARACHLPITKLTDEDAQPLILTRGDENLPIDDTSMVEEGDHITWLAPISAKPILADYCQTITPSIKRFYGDFTVLGNVLTADLVAAYGITGVTDEEQQLTLDALFRQHLNKHPVISDIIYLGQLRLRVRSMENGRIQQIGIRLPA